MKIDGARNSRLTRHRLRRHALALAAATLCTSLQAVATAGVAEAAPAGHRWHDRPVVTDVIPSAGPAGGGTTVTLAGDRFAHATAVYFGAAAAISFTVESDDRIVAIAPAGAGTVDVTVTTPAGTSSACPRDHYTYIPAPPPPSSPLLPSPQSPAPGPPTVLGGAPSTETSNGATPSGLVDPESAPTTAYFEYGLDLSLRGPGTSRVLYDQTTPVQQVGSDTTAHAVSATLTGLLPNALYHIRLVATNSAGTTFGPDQTFRTAPAPAPPPPVLGMTEVAKPVSGIVFIKRPSGTFLPLTGASQVRIGAQIDALHGSVRLTAATGHKHRTQRGTFGGAVFRLRQARTGSGKGRTTLALVEGAFGGAPSYALCTKHAAGDPVASVASRRSRTLQLLRASAHGKFTTRGRYSAATVRGTIWSIADRCDGTLVHDVTDSVSVRDFVHHRTVILHAGQSYLASTHHRRG